MRYPVSYPHFYQGGGDDFASESRDRRNLDFWSRRASRNSDSRFAPRAKSTMTLPDIGGKPVLHNTSEEPPIDMSVEAAMVAPDNYSARFIPD